MLYISDFGLCEHDDFCIEFKQYGIAFRDISKINLDKIFNLSELNIEIMHTDFAKP